MKLRPLALALAASAAALPALAQELPKFPKAPPPEPLPEAECDTSLPNDGRWLLGRWVAPQTQLGFSRDGQGPIAWTMERKGSVNEDFGWREGAVIAGTVSQATGCSVTLTAGQGDFVYQGVLAGSGKLYGFATSKDGRHVRITFRRER